MLIGNCYGFLVWVFFFFHFMPSSVTTLARGHKVSRKQNTFQLLRDNNKCIQRRSSRFFTISSLRRELPPTRTLKWPRHNQVKITCNTSNVYHMQHVCHLVQRDSSAKFDRVEIAFILAWLYWLKPLTDEGGEETRVPGENPWWRASENATY